MDRSAASTALAKAIAYVECGKKDRAVEWVAALLSDFAAEGVDVEYAFHFSAAIVPVPGEPLVDTAPVVYDLSAAATRFGSQLL